MFLKKLKRVPFWNNRFKYSPTWHHWHQTIDINPALTTLGADGWSRHIHSKIFFPFDRRDNFTIIWPKIEGIPFPFWRVPSVAGIGAGVAGYRRSSTVEWSWLMTLRRAHTIHRADTTVLLNFTYRRHACVCVCALCAKITRLLRIIWILVGRKLWKRRLIFACYADITCKLLDKPRTPRVSIAAVQPPPSVHRRVLRSSLVKAPFLRTRSLFGL